MNLTSTQKKQLLGALTLAHAQAISSLHGSSVKPDRSETIMQAFVNAMAGTSVGRSGPRPPRSSWPASKAETSSEFDREELAVLCGFDDMNEVVIETMQAIVGQQDWPYLRAVGRARASGRDSREVAGEFAMGSAVGNDREWSIYRRAAKVLADLLDQVETSSTTQQRIRSEAACLFSTKSAPKAKRSQRGVMSRLRGLAALTPPTDREAA